jgi:murein DD-endopeptidase MepM/ murein hydrolase activator NlpD
MTANEEIGHFVGRRWMDGTLAFYPAQGFGYMPLEVDGFALPVEGPASDWYLATRHSAKHSGIDVNLNRKPWGDVDLGAPVMSTCNGLVVFAGQAKGRKWGNLVVTLSVWQSHLIFWRYAHLRECHVDLSQVISIGTEVGTIGKGYGEQYAAHLHLDAWAGAMIAPESWLSVGVAWLDPIEVWKNAGYDWGWS